MTSTSRRVSRRVEIYSLLYRRHEINNILPSFPNRFLKNCSACLSSEKQRTLPRLARRNPRATVASLPSYVHILQSTGKNSTPLTLPSPLQFGQPKPTTNSSVDPSKPASSPTAPSTQPIPFDKAAWLAKLTDEQKQLLKLEIETLHESWLAALKDDVIAPSFLALKRFLRDEALSGKKVFPPSEDVYSWSRHTPLPNVKAVILGQDPYHNLNQAHGLCFSVRPPTKAPPSLKNMYTALKKDYPEFKEPPMGGGLLTPWADRGVLLLNTCLTVRAHEANSHAKKGWEQFTQKIIDLVAQKRTRGVVFLAWGKPAQDRCKGVNGTKHLVLKSVHPSPLSAHKGFLECGHFKQANEWLRTRYGEDGEIDWNLDVKPEDAGV